MNVYRISFVNKSKIVIDDEILEPIWDYLSCLYKNGQIYKDYELINDSNELFAYATLPDDNAMNELNNNIYVNRYKDKILESFKIELQVIGKNMDFDTSCTCEDTPWYMLYTDFSLTESPVVCGECGKVVPLYKLPHIQGYKEHFGVVTWQEAYSSINRLWMHCLSDRFTLRQMHDPDSQLSIEGRDICKEFEEVTGKPFYYYLFQNIRTSKKCPVCHGEWKLEETDTFIDYKCERCRVVADEVDEGGVIL